MVSSWTEKQNKKAEFAMNKELDTGGDKIDFEGLVAGDTRDAAMGKGNVRATAEALFPEVALGGTAVGERKREGLSREWY